MLIIVQNTIRVSTESKLEFKEKLDYLNRVFKDSVKNIRTNIEDIQDKYYVELGKDITDLSDEDYEYHSSEISKLEHSAKHFPQILYKSTIVSAHSIFESILSQIRKSTESITKSEIKIKQLRPVGNEIQNILNYFKLVHNFEFSNLENEQKKLNKYIRVRNCIIHQNADISQLDTSNKGAINNVIKEMEQVSKDENQILEFTDKFVTQYIEFLLKTGNSLFEQFKIEN